MTVCFNGLVYYVRVGVHVVVMVGVYMAVAVRGSAEEGAYLVRRHIWDYLLTLFKLICDIVDIVSLHNAQHHLSVDGERHIHLSALHHGRPVLVAYGMAEFYGDTDYLVGGLALELRQVYHEYGIEIEPQHNGLVGCRIKIKDIAVGDLRLAFQSHGIFYAGIALGEETAFLSGPLIEEYRFYLRVMKLVMPLVVVYVADDFCENFHNKQLNV